LGLVAGIGEIFVALNELISKNRYLSFEVFVFLFTAISAVIAVYFVASVFLAKRRQLHMKAREVQ
jgi:hypothetical protein